MEGVVGQEQPEEESTSSEWQNLVGRFSSEVLRTVSRRCQDLPRVGSLNGPRLRVHKPESVRPDEHLVKHPPGQIPTPTVPRASPKRSHHQPD
jgi:hypothetical protein